MSAQERLARGREIEGYAFTFCKAAFLALILRRYTLLGTSLGAAILYVLAARDGVREIALLREATVGRDRMQHIRVRISLLMLFTSAQIFCE